MSLLIKTFNEKLKNRTQRSIIDGARSAGVSVNYYVQQMKSGMSFCILCRNWLNITGFFIDPKTATGLSIRCKTCLSKIEKSTNNNKKIEENTLKEFAKNNKKSDYLKLSSYQNKSKKSGDKNKMAYNGSEKCEKHNSEFKVCEQCRNDDIALNVDVYQTALKKALSTVKTGYELALHVENCTACSTLLCEIAKTELQKIKYNASSQIKINDPS